MARKAQAVEAIEPEVIDGEVIDDTDGGEDRTQESEAKINARLAIVDARDNLAKVLIHSKEQTFDAWVHYGRALLAGRKTFGPKEESAYGKWVVDNKLHVLPGDDDEKGRTVSSNERTAAVTLAASSDALREVVLRSMTRNAKDARSFANKLNALKSEALELFAEYTTGTGDVVTLTLDKDDRGKGEANQLWQDDVISVTQNAVERFYEESQNDEIGYDKRIAYRRAATILEESYLSESEWQTTNKSKAVLIADATTAAVERIAKRNVEKVTFKDMSTADAAKWLFTKAKTHENGEEALRQALELMSLSLAEKASDDGDEGGEE